MLGISSGWPVFSRLLSVIIPLCDSTTVQRYCIRGIMNTGNNITVRCHIFFFVRNRTTKISLYYIIPQLYFFFFFFRRPFRSSTLPTLRPPLRRDGNHTDNTILLLPLSSRFLFFFSSGGAAMRDAGRLPDLPRQGPPEGSLGLHPREGFPRHGHPRGVR